MDKEHPRPPSQAELFQMAMQQAATEVEQEEFELLKEREKERIRARKNRSIWRRLFPWRIRFERNT